MRIVLTQQAKSDLDEIRAYLRPINPQATKSVVQAIKRAIELIAENPHVGHRTPVDEILEFIETRYSYRIPYWVSRDMIFVLRIYHPSRRPLDYEAMSARRPTK